MSAPDNSALLRDELAAIAMHALLSSASTRVTPGTNQRFTDAVAEVAYAQADSMLAERERKA